MSLPTREQFEEWSSTQVSCFLSQNKMRDCAVAVQRMKIDGRRFLNLSDNDLSKFSLIHRPQIQKIVQDIKKNDDSIFNRLKRFQTEQTANILKTGRNTIDRLTNNKPPKVPARDYPGDNQDSEQSSDSDFDNDLYEDPQGDYNYEPPPCERSFNPARKINYPGGDYLDARPGRQMQTKPMMPFLPNKPPIPEKPKQAANYDEDYIDPEEDMDDNYIDPSEKDHQGMQSGRSYSPDVYEVPDQDNSPSISRCSSKLQSPALQLPPKPSPRLHMKKPSICPEPEDKNGYDIHFDGSFSPAGSKEDREERKCVEERRPSIPVPLPREVKNPKPLALQKPSIPSRDNEVRDPASAVVSPPTTSSSFFLVNRSLQRDNLCKRRGSLPQEDSATRQQEEEAGVYKKPWYASNCDRKTAEDTLTRSAKDGSYMVRKSSGVDALQPYTLVVFYNGRVYNIPVRYILATKQYALGKQKNREERFKTVSEIIENHQKNTLVLVDMQSNTKDSTTLKHAIKP
ncbi:B-cell linker protein isoform X3 [Silurus meridionalis]|uniref:B-cell linker protein isoform X3 n=1 Tax=Silurus meridionalis TaxID=175797 RepID=UPI001EECBDC6|nr:B-cell linker protein isoform X3 [Silurus meridionalis]